MKLRDYQQRAIDQTMDWFTVNKTGNPCIVMPTGSGKSHVIAAFCKMVLAEFTDNRILMLTHVKELIEQNAEKMLAHWRDAPLGIFSAGLRRKDIDQITFGSIQSLRNRAKELGHIDIILVDECFTAETKIATPSGEVDIDKVRCGDIVLNQCGLGVVEAISCRPALETYIVELSDGRTIECTGNHPFFTQSGWTRARELASGSYLVGLEDMSFLWENIQTLDKNKRRKSRFSNSGRNLEQAKFLLREVCKEVITYSPKCPSAQKDQQAPQRNQAQAYQAWRKRAIAAFASAGVAARSWGRLDGRVFSKDKRRTQKWHLSECVQGRHCKSRNDDCDRDRRPFSRPHEKTGTRPQKNRASSGAWVVSVSRIERKSHVPVYNLQVSGHPSYFANGLAVHNCHLINHKNDGSYRKLINKLRKINPEIRVIGLTATPYRLGHGYITDGDGLFSAMIEPVTIEELVHRNFLAPLRSKLTDMQLDVSGVGKRGGEYIESQLQAAVNQRHNNVSAVREVIKRAEDRKAWLFFCTGVEHAEAVRDILLEFGISAGCVTGETPAKDRERMLDEFRTGELRAMTNANVLTTGFDYPDIDLIAMLRPTKSTALYVQMAGRGMRPKSEARDGDDYPVGNCLVMDFAGVVKEHGPITNIQIKSVNSKRKPGEPPVKACPECHELVHLSVMECEACGYKWPQKTKSMTLHDNDIMAVEDAMMMEVKSWRWRKHFSRSGYYGLSLTYYGELFEKPVIEYFSVQHPGLGGDVALRKVMDLAVSSGVRMADLSEETDLQRVADILSAGAAPISIKYTKNERFISVVKREWI